MTKIPGYHIRSYSNLIDIVGNNIRMARIFLNLSLFDLSLRSGSSQQVISKAENCKGMITIKNLHAIAGGLGLDIADILTDDTPRLLRLIQPLRYEKKKR